MRVAVVGHPEPLPRRGVPVASHQLGCQAPERRGAGGRLTAPEQVGLVRVPGGEVGQRAAALVFVLHAHRLANSSCRFQPAILMREGGHAMKIKVKKVEKILATATAIEY
jgi:hypothetical protein